MGCYDCAVQLLRVAQAALPLLLPLLEPYLQSAAQATGPGAGAGGAGAGVGVGQDGAPLGDITHHLATQPAAG